MEIPRRPLKLLYPKPTYATSTLTIMLIAPTRTPAPPIHLLRSMLFTIATPNIAATAPCRMRKMLLVPYSSHLIPSATRNVMSLSSVGPRIYCHLECNSVNSLKNSDDTSCHYSNCKAYPG